MLMVTTLALTTTCESLGSGRNRHETHMPYHRLQIYKIGPLPQTAQIRLIAQASFGPSIDILCEIVNDTWVVGCVRDVLFVWDFVSMRAQAWVNEDLLDYERVITVKVRSYGLLPQNSSVV